MTTDRIEQGTGGVETLVDDFLGGRAYGVRIVVLPEDGAHIERQLVTDVLRRHVDPTGVVLAIGNGNIGERRSIRDALVEGHYAFQNRGQRFQGFLRRAEETISAIGEDVGGSLLASAAKGCLRWLTRSPVSCLHKEPYAVTQIAEALRALVEQAPVVLHIRRASRDDGESLRFLTQTCTEQLEQMLGDARHRFLAVLAVGPEDRKKDRWRDVLDREPEDGFGVIELGDEADGEDRGDASGEELATWLLAQDLATIEIAAFVTAWFLAAKTEPLAERLLEASSGLRPDIPLRSLEARGVIARVRIDEQPFLVLGERYDASELEEAFLEAFDTLVERAEAEPVVHELDPSNAAFLILDKYADDAGTDDPEISLMLAALGNEPVPGIVATSRIVAAHVAAGDLDGLAARTNLLARAADELTPYGLDEEADTDDALARALTSFAEHLARFGLERWDALAAALGGILATWLDQFESRLPNARAAELRDLAAAYQGHLLVQTDTGRMKLVSLGLLPERRRGLAGSPCLRRPDRDGRVSEIATVSTGQMAWSFCSNHEAVCFPLTAIDAIYDDVGLMDAACENMSIALELRRSWREPADRVLATCIVPAAVPPGSVVALLSDSGRCHVLDASLLPTGAGDRMRFGEGAEAAIDLDGNPPRWAVLVTPQDDLLVATTGNRVLRLAHDELRNRTGTTIDGVVALDAGDRVAAAATAAIDADFSAAVLLVSDGGYGRLVLADAFRRGKPGSRGVVAGKEGKRAGSLCTIESVPARGSFLLSTANGAVARIGRDAIPFRRRDRVGVKLISLAPGDRVVGACPC